MPLTPAPAPRPHDTARSSAAAALNAFRVTLDGVPEPRGQGEWRWRVRRQLAALRDALADESGRVADDWLAPRSEALSREAGALLARVRTLGARVLAEDDVLPVRSDLRRLAGDVAHHLQRRSDLTWEQVEQEYGGSE